MKLEISIKDVQRIKQMEFAVDLQEESLICIAGKNGAGKTTLIKAVRNLVNADTFPRTSAPRSFSDASEIIYKVDGRAIVFKYDRIKKVMDTRDAVPNILRKGISIELPIPHGERFNFFKKISEIDSSLRTQVVLKNYSRPGELVDFLASIYATTRFADLVEVKVKNLPYYAIIFPDNYYLREDYFSSGEYFLISLYRRIVAGYMAIFIDEIDISLDAAAQVRLVGWLRKFAKIYKTTFIFTTHSLAMMRTLDPNELYYMEARDDGTSVIENRSYAFVKSTLFGFRGWDKYILTEDDVLKDFLEYFILKHCRPSFFQHKIIYVGGGTNTTDLMARNSQEKFFSKDSNSVMSVLDGDQSGQSHTRLANVFCVPFQSVEKELLAKCLAGEFGDTAKIKLIVEDYQRLMDFMNKTSSKNGNMFKAIFYRLVLFFKKTTLLRRRLSVANGEPATSKDFKAAGKKLFKKLTKADYTRHEIFEFLIRKNWSEIQILRSHLEAFIGAENGQQRR